MPRVLILQPSDQLESVILGTLSLPKGLIVKVEGQDEPVEVAEQPKNNYRLQVLAVHQLLDELQIPAVEDGFECTDVGCNSKLEHRVRHLITLYREQKKALDNAKTVAASEAIGLIRGRLLEALNGTGRKH